MKSSGFSLIEVMVSSALFLASVGGVVSAISSASSVYEHQRRLTQAVSVGEYKMEELLLRYSSHADLAITAKTDAAGVLESGTPNMTCLTPRLTPVTCPVSLTAAGTKVQVNNDIGSNYLVYWFVSAAPVQGLKQVDLFVAWNEAGGQRELPLMTYRR
jgi:Tfp pilus assembly protein PilV